MSKKDTLWVFPREGTQARKQSVRDTALIRDYYRVQSGKDPARLEKALAGLEDGTAPVFNQISIKRILDHLGLSPPGQEEPAPTPEVVRVPVDDEGREILAG